MHQKFSVYGDSVALPRGIHLPRATRNAPETQPSITFCQVETLPLAHEPAVVPSDGFSCTPLNSDTDLLRWDPYCQFEIHYAKRLARFALNGPLGQEAFEDYYLSQVLSFFFVHERREPLHASVVANGRHSVALLGESGTGKSSMVAALLAIGWKLISDDLAMVRIERDHCKVHPGLPRLKLCPDVASMYCSQQTVADSARRVSNKLVWHLDTHRYRSSPIKLSCCVLLNRTSRESGDIAAFSECSKTEALLTFLRNAYNTIKSDALRARTQFEFFSQLANSVPVLKLDYSDNLAYLDEVAARLADRLR